MFDPEIGSFVRTEMDLDEVPHIYVEHISDAEAEEILQRRKQREKYYERMDNRPPDTRPMCTEAAGVWHCPNRATTEYKGVRYCKIHSKMHMSWDAHKQQ